MDVFGDLERFLSEDLYPYRWPITIALVLVGIALVALVLRLGWHRVLWRHRVVTAIIAIPVATILFAVGWYTLSPLWDRSYLDEASPLAAAEMTAPTQADAAPPGEASEPTPFAARVTHTGMFTGADDFHFGRGAAQLIETVPGVFTLRFEDFSVRNGPDLYVYLTPDASGESIDGAINLGGLKATDGAFNYEVPPGTDVSQYEGAIVWCRQFATLFAVAELMPF